jgi:hypothetical protein
MFYSDYVYGVAESRLRVEEALRVSEHARSVGYVRSTKAPLKSMVARSAALVMAMVR